MPRSPVHRRLRSLATLELVNIPLQAWVWFGVAGFPPSAANVVGFALVAILLLQGTGYWVAKLRQLSAGRRRLPGVAVFRLLRVANPPLLFAGTVLAVWSTVGTPGRSSIPGLAFALFAWLEYVNYFHVQLMYDNRADLRRLRARGLVRASLARDLDRAMRSHAERPRT
ncbi:hypothetical protein AB0I28_01330 [Phytomonospora sp. NPDC050363]|uniref:hypothetical protein n=1 Tax=Phytomonospora sp. NPDC050363 TaxID=3155642 RepID=UPI0033C4EA44